MRVRLAFDMKPGIGLDAWARRLETYEEAARDHKKDPWIGTGILKAFADGVVESRTALLLEPYVGMSADDPGALGISSWEPGELAAAVRAASERGWQVEIHAIGDRAISDALDAFAECGPARRHRVEHIEAPASADIARFGQLGVIASMQPQHAEPIKNLREVWAPHLGPERAARGWPWASIARSGGRLAFGSDWPVVTLNPWIGVQTAVTRQTVSGDPPGGFHPEQRLTLVRAIEGYTLGAAVAGRREKTEGSLEPGKMADLILVSPNIFAADPHAIGKTKVLLTMVGGKVVYHAPGWPPSSKKPGGETKR